MVPLLLFSLLLILRIALRFLPSLLPWGNKKRLSDQEAELVRQIKQLNREADALNTPATFAKSSKLRRAAVAKEKELAPMKQSSGGGDYGWLATKLSLLGDQGDSDPRSRRMVQADIRGFCSSFSSAALRWDVGCKGA